MVDPKDSWQTLFIFSLPEISFGMPREITRLIERCNLKSIEIRTGFPPVFFLCQQHVTMRQVPRTGTRCRCRFLSQLSQCKNAPKTPGLTWVLAGSTPPCPNRHVSCLRSHIPMGTLCNSWLSQPYHQSESHPWTPIHPRRYLSICPLEVYMFKKIRVSKGNYTIQMTEKKEPRHASVLVWVYNDTNLIIWRCSYICRTRRESLGSESGFFLGIYCLSQRRTDREYDPEGFLCMRVFDCVCVRACGQHVGTTQASLLDGRPLPHFR